MAGVSAVGIVRDTVTRHLAHEPLGWRHTTLLVSVRRYRSGITEARQRAARAPTPA